MKIEIVRSYNAVTQNKKSPRYLVDRLWPRGIKKEVLQLDAWEKDLSPSNELRKWYDHDPKKWESFKREYFKELDGHPDAVNDFLAAIKGEKEITLVYSSTEKELNNAVALREYILSREKDGRQ